MISELEGLEYASVGTGNLYDAKGLLRRRRESYTGYGYRLTRYKNDINDMEERFVAAMRNVVTA